MKAGLADAGWGRYYGRRLRLFARRNREPVTTTYRSPALAQSGLVPVDAQVLLAHVLGHDRAWLVAHAEDVLPRTQADAFFALARRRHDGEPVAYLTGFREFWGFALAVSPAVLIPRPETETLVELALARLPRRSATCACSISAPDRARSRSRSPTSGRAARSWRPTSAAALRSRATTRDGSARSTSSSCMPIGTNELRRRGGMRAFDVIVSNPPYIAAGDPHLGEGDVRFEPGRRSRPAATGSRRSRASSPARARALPPAGRWSSSTVTIRRRRCARCFSPRASPRSRRARSRRHSARRRGVEGRSGAGARSRIRDRSASTRGESSR